MLDIIWMSRRACAISHYMTDMGLHEAFTNGEILWCTVYEHDRSQCLGPEHDDALE